MVTTNDTKSTNGDLSFAPFILSIGRAETPAPQWGSSLYVLRQLYQRIDMHLRDFAMSVRGTSSRKLAPRVVQAFF